MRRILMIEDDDAIIYSLSEYFREEGFLADAVRSLRETETINIDIYCLILLDLGLPDGDGWTFLTRHFTGGNPSYAGEKAAMNRAVVPPVIILTARDGDADIMRGLDMGADDYVTKPFRAGVLLSRVRAVLRRRERMEPGETLSCGELLLNKTTTTATIGGTPLVLTAGEFRLLIYFMENRGRTLTRNALLTHLWDSDGAFVNDNTLTVTIRRLREKLGEEGRQMLKTVRGIGYRMEACDD